MDYCLISDQFACFCQVPPPQLQNSLLTLQFALLRSLTVGSSPFHGMAKVQCFAAVVRFFLPGSSLWQAIELGGFQDTSSSLPQTQADSTRPKYHFEAKLKVCGFAHLWTCKASSGSKEQLAQREASAERKVRESATKFIQTVPTGQRPISSWHR